MLKKIIGKMLDEYFCRKFELNADEYEKSINAIVKDVLMKESELGKGATSVIGKEVKKIIENRQIAQYSKLTSEQLKKYDIIEEFSFTGKTFECYMSDVAKNTAIIDAKDKIIRYAKMIGASVIYFTEIESRCVVDNDPSFTYHSRVTAVALKEK